MEGRGRTSIFRVPNTITILISISPQNNILKTDISYDPPMQWALFWVLGISGEQNKIPTLIELTF